MSISKLLNNKLEEANERFHDYLENFSKIDAENALFMFYCLENIFKSLDLDEIENGVIDSSYRKESHDYGIDAIYITSNKETIENTEILDNFNEDSKFIIHIMQFKNKTGVDQSELLKFKEGINTAFIENNYYIDNNEFINNRMNLINEIKDCIYKKFSVSQLQIKLYIIFRGFKDNIINNRLLKKQINDTEKMLTENGYQNNYEIIDIQEIIELSKKGEEIIDIITYKEKLKYITDLGNNNKLNGYISIINGMEIARLVKDWQTALFEANIRDYFRTNSINQKIFNTCVNSEESNFFWSFNNGITIVCSKVEELSASRFKLYGIQIVNGCQTSNSLYKALHNKEEFDILNSKTREDLTNNEVKLLNNLINNKLIENTALLVKIIETNNSDLIYRITETTNSQIPIDIFSLSSPQDIHKNIEEFLLKYKIYYERRINYYKNQGKKNIVSIKKLFQLYVSQILIKPSQARTNPKTLFGSISEKVFPTSLKDQNDYLLYLIPIKIDIKVSKLIRNIQRNKLIEDGYKLRLLSYGKFHLGCFIISEILAKKYNEKILIKNETLINNMLEDSSQFYDLFVKALNNFEKIVKKLVGQKKESIQLALRKSELDDRIAKYVRAN